MYSWYVVCKGRVHGSCFPPKVAVSSSAWLLQGILQTVRIPYISQQCGGPSVSGSEKAQIRHLLRRADAQIAHGMLEGNRISQRMHVSQGGGHLSFERRTLTYW